MHISGVHPDTSHSQKKHGSPDGAAPIFPRTRTRPIAGRIPAGWLLAFACLLLCLVPIVPSSNPALALEGSAAGNSTNGVIFLQRRISEDIAAPREAVEAALKDFPLGSADVELRLEQLSALTASASEDMAQWGYLEDERERYSYLLSDLTAFYTTYNTNLKALSARQQSGIATVTVSGDAGPQNPASADINAYDALKQSVHKLKQDLDVQVFYLRSTLNKLDIALADLDRLKKDAPLQGEGTNGGDDARRPRIKALELESARLKIASAWLQAREAKLRCDETVERILQGQVGLERIQASLTFSEQTLNQNVEALQKRIDELKQQLNAAKEKFDEGSTALNQARAAITSDGVDLGTLTPSSSRYMERLANLNYWEFYTGLIQDEIELLINAQKIWRARYQLFNNKASGEEIWQYRNEAQDRITGLQTHLESIRALQNDFYQRIATTRAQASEATGKTKQNLNQMLQAQQNTITNVLNRYTFLLPNQILLERTLYEEAGARIDTLRLAEKVGDFSKKTFLSFWHTELWKGEDYSVTVSKLVTALLVFISSFFLSAWGSRWIQGRMIRRFSSSVTAANATQRIVFYILWFSFVLIALQIVGIPLTAFAFLGGALVLAIGFGAQTLFNNLISGFIIMFSRPFQIADTIEVDGIAGTVEEIGSRSTRVKTWENVDVILPNRYLLENRVMNWTGSDKKKRDTLQVRVSYGADSRRVEELLQKVLKDHSKVLKDPAPFVLFKEFGECGLEFMLYFWVDLGVASSPKVASDMRHHIHSLFRNEGISIPYPHLDIRLCPDPEAHEESPLPGREKATPQEKNAASPKNTGVPRQGTA